MLLLNPSSIRSLVLLMERNLHCSSQLFHLESVEEFRIEISAAEIFIFHELEMERDRCFDTFYHIFRQCPVHCIDGFATCSGYRNDLGNHGVIIWRNGITGINM